jgi:3-oxoacyl-[acyl-carrier protein] reductase
VIEVVVSSESGSLSGRAALVTGAAGAIGRAIGAALAAAGARVVLADRSVEVNEFASGSGAVGTVVFDVTDEASIVAGVQDASALVGGIDILVNSHGMLTESSLVDMSLEQWSETMAVDLTSVFLLCRAVLPGMLERRFGRIINVASQLAIKGGVGMSHYAAAKAGVIALTKSLALEVAPHGVLVNAVAPGPIETALLDQISDDWKSAKRAELPLGRFGTPDEVAPTVVLLASEPGGNLYVGQTLGPNSGDVMP